MNATYRIVMDAAYCTDLVERYRRQLPMFLRPGVVALMPLVVLAIVWLVYARSNAAFQGVFPWLAAALLAMAVLDYVVLRQLPVRRLLRRAGESITYTLTDEGLEAVGPLAEGKLKWAAYPRSVRFADGFLLLRPGTICWLPDVALKGANSGAVLELLRAKTTLRSVV